VATIVITRVRKKRILLLREREKLKPKKAQVVGRPPNERGNVT
jgi:hypothetical protein